MPSRKAHGSHETPAIVRDQSGASEWNSTDLAITAQSDSPDLFFIITNAANRTVTIHPAPEPTPRCIKDVCMVLRDLLGFGPNLSQKYRYEDKFYVFTLNITGFFQNQKIENRSKLQRNLLRLLEWINSRDLRLLRKRTCQIVDKPDLTYGQIQAHIVSRYSWTSALQYCNERLGGDRQSPILAKNSNTVQGNVTADEEKTTVALRKALREALGESGGDYLEQRAALAKNLDVVRQEMARNIGPAFNSYLASLPSKTYDEKKTLAKFINLELRKFGWAILCPRTSKLCAILANGGGQPGIGRFVLDTDAGNGKRQQTISSVKLPYLDLVAADLTRSVHSEPTLTR
jgi:hypothetical protein